jgi:chromosomal replication initiation ATPase DnaA
MEVDIQILPAVNRIVTNCESQLSNIMGFPVTVKIQMQPKSVNDVTIQTLVCDLFNVTWHELISTTRKREVIRGRFAYWYLCFKHLKKSKSELAREFGKDHTSVIHGIGEVEKWIKQGDMLMSSKLSTIEDIINETEVLHRALIHKTCV